MGMTKALIIISSTILICIVILVKTKFNNEKELKDFNNNVKNYEEDNL